MLKRFGYVVATLLIVAVPPIILVNFPVWPDIDWDALGGRLTNGDIPYELLIAVLSGIGWLTWLSTVLSIVVEFVAAVRNFEAPSLAVFPGTQNAGRRLVAGMLMSINSMTPAVAGGLAVVPIAVPVTQVVDEVSTTPELRSQADSSDAAGRYKVERGDTFMSLAALISDDTDGWRTLRSDNVDVKMPSGAAITSQTITVEPGTLLRVPADSSLAQATHQHTVSSADAISDSTTVEVGEFALDDSQITVNAKSPQDQNAARLRVVSDSDTDSVTNADLNETARQAADDEVVDGGVVGSWRVVEGDNFWAVSHQVLEVALGTEPTDTELFQYWDRVVDANEEHTLSGDADLIYAGEEFDILLPAIPGADVDRLSALSQFTAAPPAGPVKEAAAKPEPTPAATPAPTTAATVAATPEPTPAATPEPTPAATLAATPEVAATAEESLSTRFKVGAGAGLVIAGIAAAGVMLRIRKKRELAHAKRLAGERLDPAGETEPTEAQQRSLEERALRERLMNALHVVKRDIAGEGDVMLAQVDGDGVIELAFDHAVIPGPPPGGIWNAAESDSHAIWTLTGEPRTDDRDASLPPLVGIGDGTYLNLVSAGTLSIGGGSLGERGDHLRSIIHDLGFGPAAGELMLRLGAIGEAGDETVARVPASPMAEVAKEAEDFMDVIDNEHNRLGTDRLSKLCHAGGLTDTEVMVVVCAESEMVPLRDAIARVENAPGRYPVAFVVLAEGSTVPAARWSCQLDGSTVALKSDMLGGALRVEAATMGREEAAALNAALAAAVGSTPRTLGLVDDAEAEYYDQVAPASAISETEAVVESLGDPAHETASVLHSGSEPYGYPPDHEDDSADEDSEEEADSEGSDSETDDLDDGDGATPMTLNEVIDAFSMDVTPEQLAAAAASLANEEIEFVTPGTYPSVTIVEDEGDSGGAMGQQLHTVLASRMAERTIRADILGPVEISGIIPGAELGEYERSLLSAMVFIDRPVAIAEITSLLWPDTDIGARRVREVRRNLRNAIGGAMQVEDGRWSLAVESDLADFERLRNHASEQTGRDGLETLKRAMELVRGVPLEGAISKAWAWADANDRPREILRQRVVDTALAFAGRAATENEWDMSLEATRVGRRVEPYSVELQIAAVKALMHKGENGLALNEVNDWEAAFEAHFSIVPPMGPRTALELQQDVKQG